jgi:hypothetical protein
MNEHDWRAERRHLQRRLVETEFQRLAAEARATAAEQALAEVQARLTYVENDLAGLRAETAALRSSTSWKVTRPLRGASRLLGKGG